VGRRCGCSARPRCGPNWAGRSLRRCWRWWGIGIFDTPCRAAIISRVAGGRAAGVADQRHGRRGGPAGAAGREGEQGLPVLPLHGGTALAGLSRLRPSTRARWWRCRIACGPTGRVNSAWDRAVATADAAARLRVALPGRLRERKPVGAVRCGARLGDSGDKPVREPRERACCRMHQVNGQRAIPPSALPRAAFKKPRSTPRGSPA